VKEQSISLFAAGHAERSQKQTKGGSSVRLEPPFVDDALLWREAP
jgi:hypothetical protein